MRMIKTKYPFLLKEILKIKEQLAKQTLATKGKQMI